MKNKLGTGKILILACVLLLAAGGAAFPVELPGLDVFGGLQWLGNAVDNSGPNPIMGVWGIGLPLEFSQLISLDPELSMFGTQYQLADDGVKAAPTEIEYAHNLWALMLMLDVPVRFTIHLTDTISTGAGAHLSFLFRIPTIGWGDASARTGDAEHRAAIVSYFYDNARFFYPGIDLFFNWKYFEKIGFYVRILSLFPLFHAWDGENAPFWDQLILSGRIGIRIYFK